MIHIYKSIMIIPSSGFGSVRGNQRSKEEGTTAERPPILVLASL